MSRKGQKRATKEETEVLQRKIWLYRSRGLSITQIAKAVNKARSTVAYHLRQARLNAYQYYEGAGEEEIIGQMLMLFRETRNEAMRNLARTEPASNMRLKWLFETRAAIKAEAAFMFDLGIIRKMPDQLDVTITDVRRMSSDEIARAMLRMQEELAHATVQGINIPRNGETQMLPHRGEIIDVVPTNVTPTNGNGSRDEDEEDDEHDELPMLEEVPEGFEGLDPDELADEFSEYEDFETYGIASMEIEPGAGP